MRSGQRAAAAGVAAAAVACADSFDRIDDFFRRTTILPPNGDPTEYAAAFEAVYAQARHRRQYRLVR